MDFRSLLILMVVVYTAGRVFRHFGLPVLFGELVGGILVGPAVFGFVQVGNEVIEVIAELGVFFLMLHSGLETDPRDLLKSLKSSSLIAIGGFALPFILGYFVTRGFGYDFNTALFVGIASSISSIALCARLFKDFGLTDTKVYHMTLGAAMVDDILALVAFSVVLSIVETGTIDMGALAVLLLKVVAFFGVVLWAGFKLSKHLGRLIYSGYRGFTVTLIIALALGLIAEAIGLHIIIGAFLAGLFIREEIIDQKAWKKIEDRVYGLAYFFFGPVFFASLAFHLNFKIFEGGTVYFIVFILTAVLGKFFGAGIVAKYFGLSWTHAGAIGASMNSRGAVELIIAAIGLKLGVIDENIFSALIMMAVVTTVASIFLMRPFAQRMQKELTTNTPSAIN